MARETPCPWHVNRGNERGITIGDTHWIAAASRGCADARDCDTASAGGLLCAPGCLLPHGRHAARCHGAVARASRRLVLLPGHRAAVDCQLAGEGVTVPTSTQVRPSWSNG